MRLRRLRSAVALAAGVLAVVVPTSITPFDRARAAAVLRVPSQYPTITAAGFVAQSGDTILVAPGHYVEAPLIFNAVDVISEGGPQVTVLEKQSGAFFGAGALEGFTIANSISSPFTSVARFRNNVFVGNRFDSGVLLPGASTIFESNLVWNNECHGSTALLGFGPGSVVRNNVFIGNACAVVSSTASGTIEHNTFVRNDVAIGSWSGAGMIINNAFVDNDVAVARPAQLTIANNLFEGNEVDVDGSPSPVGTLGNISGDPGFGEIRDADVRPRSGSVLIDAAQAAWPTDLDGTARTDGDGDTVVESDIGAHEFDGNVVPFAPVDSLQIDSAYWPGTASQTLSGSLEGVEARPAATWPQVRILPPIGRRLTVGRVFVGSRDRFLGSFSIVNAWGRADHGCSGARGWLDIERVLLDAQGSLAALQASFDVQCSSESRLRGGVRLSSQPAPSNPTALDDDYRVAVGRTLTRAASRGVLSNDADSDSVTIAAVLVRAPSDGVVNLRVDGGFDYTPASGFEGVDSFEYRVFDGAHLSEAAIARVSVGRPKLSWIGITGSRLEPANSQLHTVEAVERTRRRIVVAFSSSSGEVGRATLNAPSGGFERGVSTSAFEIRLRGAVCAGAQSRIEHLVLDARGRVEQLAASVTCRDGRAAGVWFQRPAAMPVAVDDDFSDQAGAGLAIVAPGVLANDVGSGLNAVIDVHPDSATGILEYFQRLGSFQYIPQTPTGTASFAYHVVDARGFRSPPAVVSVRNHRGDFIGWEISDNNGRVRARNVALRTGDLVSGGAGLRRLINGTGTFPSGSTDGRIAF